MARGLKNSIRGTEINYWITSHGKNQCVIWVIADRRKWYNNMSVSFSPYWLSDVWVCEAVRRQEDFIRRFGFKMEWMIAAHMQHMQLLSSHTGLYRKTEVVWKEFHDRCHFYINMNTEKRRDRSKNKVRIHVEYKQQTKAEEMRNMQNRAENMLHC